MSSASVTLLGMAFVLAVLLAGLTLSVGYGIIAAFAAYAFGGSACLLLMAVGSSLQDLEFGNR